MLTRLNMVLTDHATERFKHRFGVEDEDRMRELSASAWESGRVLICHERDLEKRMLGGRIYLFRETRAGVVVITLYEYEPSVSWQELGGAMKRECPVRASYPSDLMRWVRPPRRSGRRVSRKMRK